PKGVFADLVAAARIPKEMVKDSAALKPHNPLIVYDQDNSPVETLDGLPTWIRNKALGAPVFVEHTADKGPGNFTEMDRFDDIPW
ncbi:MAG: hypothetical protein ACREA4_10085, partial [Nitrososphaera sp.]